MEKTRKNNQSLSNVLISDWPLLLLLLGIFIAGAVLYPRLPEMMPSHWNFKGEVDRYSSRFWGAFGIPLTTAGIYTLMLVLPSIISLTACKTSSQEVGD